MYIINECKRSFLERTKIITKSLTEHIYSLKQHAYHIKQIMADHR